jgi:hypothetical protein
VAWIAEAIAAWNEFVAGAGGEVANARVCKTCIRGFNSRPALQFLKDLLFHWTRISIADPNHEFRRTTMSKSNSQPDESQPAISSGPSLDIYAVALALLAALLVRFNLIPPIKW